MKCEVKLVPITDERDMANHKQVCYLPGSNGVFIPHKIIVVSKQREDET